MLNVGNMAKTYGTLPHEVLENATTYDLMITDVMNTWEQYQIDKASGKPHHDIPEDELLEMIKKGKERV